MLAEAECVASVRPCWMQCCVGLQRPDEYQHEGGYIGDRHQLAEHAVVDAQRMSRQMATMRQVVHTFVAGVPCRYGCFIMHMERRRRQHGDEDGQQQSRRE